MIPGKHHTGMFDLIQPHCALDLAVEDNEAKVLFLVRSDLQQHKIADDRIVDLGVVERLVRVVDRLGIDSFAGVCVVLDLDRQVATDGLNKDAIFDGDVGVRPVVMLVARRLGPAELVLGRVAYFVFAAIVEILDRIGCHSPFERLDVTRSLSDLKDHVQHRTSAKESQETRVFVEPVQFVKVAFESLVADDGE